LFKNLLRNGAPVKGFEANYRWEKAGDSPARSNSDDAGPHRVIPP